jgi:hypothetical protein
MPRRRVRRDGRRAARMSKTWRDIGQRGEPGEEPWRPQASFHRSPPTAKDVQGLHQSVRRGGRGRGSVRLRGADKTAQLSRQAALQPAGRGGEARQPPAAPPDGAAEPLLGFRSRGRPARCARLTRVVIRPDAALSFKQSSATPIPRHRGDAAARQFRLDARPPDHGGRHCAPTYLARTLERCGVKVEILGFTTRAWKGGQSRENAGSPPASPANPGRLNDLRHIIYKAADTPWRRAGAISA